ncbi:hypothetical protein QTP88_013214 [Uroleucon formosanum]
MFVDRLQLKHNGVKLQMIFGIFTTIVLYQLYFGCPLGDQDKAWVPHTICSAYFNGLRDWLNKKKSSTPFAIPMVWREQKNHYDCYFCNVNVNDFSKKNKHNINYPNLDSAIRPVKHSASLPIPIPPEEGLNLNIEMECDQDSFDHYDECPEDADYTPDEDKSSLQTFSQGELNNLIRDLSLSKEKAELLASRLKQKKLFQKNVRVDGPLCNAHDINGLFKALSQDYIISDWRLFIDSSQRSLKAVLLHNAMGKTNSEGFQYLKEKFPKVSAAKLKGGILIGPQIRELIKDNNFVCRLIQLSKKHGRHLYGLVKTSWKITKRLHIRMEFKIY